ncbi:MAG: hypothetical protein MZV70_76270 [Desulfobacterales bacterium]|nr:hypothetical protein [Desulfobacterales bacterium]
MAREFNENIAQCLSAVKLRTEAMLQLSEGETPSAMVGSLKLDHRGLGDNGRRRPRDDQTAQPADGG